MNEQHIPVEYNDEQHLYTHRQQRYTSASQLYELFKEPFPEDAHIKYAEKYGETPEYWKQKWAEKNKKSKERGNIIHDSNEIVLQARMLDLFEGQQLPVISEAVGEEQPWLTRPDGIYTERKVWHHGYRIAGRADKIILQTDKSSLMSREDKPWGWWGEQGKRFAHIEDYKTNEKLDFESYQYKNGSHKTMLPPLGHVMDCNWFHYCLQLSTYMFMLEYQGFLPGKIAIIHYPHPTAEDSRPKPVRYDVPYMKKEVFLMCTYNLRRNVS